MDRTIPKNAPPGKRYSIRVQRIAYALMICGVIAACTLGYHNWNEQRIRRRIHVEELVQTAAESLQRDLRPGVLALQQTRRYVVGNLPRDAEQLQNWMRGLLEGTPGTTGCAWLSIDPQAIPSFVLGQISQQQCGTKLLNETRAHVQAQAGTIHPISALQLEGQRAHGQLTLFAAVYDTTGVTSGTTKGSLQGLLLLAFDARAFLTLALREHPAPMPMLIELLDEASSTSLAQIEVPGAFIPDGSTTDGLQETEWDPDDPMKMQGGLPLMLSGTRLTLRLSTNPAPPPHAMVELWLMPLLLLLLALALPLLLLAYAHHSLALEDKLYRRQAELAASTQAQEKEARRRREVEADLRQVQERLRGLLADQTELSVGLTPEWTITRLNPAASRALLRTEQQLTGSSFLSLLPEPDRSQLLHQIGQWPTGQQATLEFTVRLELGDGRLRWYQWDCRPLRDGGGSIVELLATGRDVTALTEARQEAKRLGVLLEYTNEWVTLTDREGEILFLNAAGRRLAGWGPMQELPTYLGDLFPACQLTLEQALAATQRQPLWTGQLDLMSCGEVRQIELNVCQIQLAGEVPSGDLCVWIGRDVTERERQGERLRQSEERYRAIFESAQESIWIVDNEHRSVMANPELHALLGCDSEYLTGRSVFEFVQESDHSTLALELARGAGTPRRTNLPLRLRRGDGREIWTQAALAPLRDAAGNRIGTFLLLQDTTSRIELENRIRESELIHRALLEQSRDLIVLEDGNGRITYLSPLADTLLPRELVEAYRANGQVAVERLLERVHPADRPRLERHRDRHHLAPAEEALFHRFAGPDGTHHWMRHFITHVQDGSQPAGMVHVLRDVNAVKRAEEALRETEERMWLGLHETGIGIWDADLLSGEVHFVNHWAAILGYPPDQTRDHLSMWETRIHPDDREDVLHAWNEHLAGHTPAYETVHRLPDAHGEWHWVRHRGMVIERDSDGQALRAVGMHMDVTRQREIEEQLRRYAAVIDQAAEMIAITDLQGNIAYVNLAFEALLGMRRHEALGRPMYPLLTGDATREIHQGIWQTLGSGNVWRGNLQHARDGLAPRTIIATFSPLHDAEHRVTNYVVVQLDITREIELERRMQQMNRLSIIGQTVTGVAHQIRNIMSKVKGSVHVLDDALAEDEHLSDIWAILKRNTDQIGALAENMLGYAQIEQLRQTPIDLNHLIELHLAEFRLGVPDASVVFEFEPEPVLPLIIGDETRLSDVITNLVINGMHASHDQSPARIRITTAYDIAEQAAIITVADNGCGIPPENLKKIFSPFFTTKGHKGTGLGLAITQKTILAHGGSIDVTSEPGNTVFRIHLPQSYGAMHLGEHPVPPPAPPTGNATA